jgi:hypothetical protein
MIGPLVLAVAGAKFVRRARPTSVIGGPAPLAGAGFALLVCC